MTEVLFPTFQIFELALTVGVLYYGGHLVLLNIISGGTLVSFILYQLELGNCIDVGFHSIVVFVWDIVKEN